MRTARFLALSSVACLAAVFITAAADAQQQDGNNGGRQRGGQQRGGFGGPGGGFGGPGGPGGPGGGTIDRATLLGAESVKEELEINDAQSVTLTAAIDAYRQERSESRPDRSAFENLSEEERQAMFQKMQKDREALSKKTDELLNAMLEPEQVKRLDEISLQSRLRGGIIATLKSDELKSALSVTDEQIKGLEAIEETVRAAQEKMREEMRANFQRGGGNGGGDGGNRPDFTQMRERMETARKETETKVLAVLTDAQKSKLDEMKGKPFELDPRELMGGRGGFGGQGGDGQGGRGRGNGQGQGNDNGGGRRRPAAESEAI